jgi:hypothetical protein
MLTPEQRKVLEVLARGGNWYSTREVTWGLLTPQAILALGMPSNRPAWNRLYQNVRRMLEVLCGAGLAERRQDPVEHSPVKTWEYAETEAGRKALEEQA